MKLTTENTEMEWRDASVTLPDDGETVIIHTKDGEVWTGFIDGDGWRNVAGERIYDYDPVLHWMPLPNPPREEVEYYRERYEQLKEGGNQRTPEIPKWYNGREIPADIKEGTK